MDRDKTNMLALIISLFSTLLILILFYIKAESKIDYKLILDGDSIEVIDDNGDSHMIQPEDLEEFIERDNL